MSSQCCWGRLCRNTCRGRGRALTTGHLLRLWGFTQLYHFLPLGNNIIIMSYCYRMQCMFCLKVDIGHVKFEVYYWIQYTHKNLFRLINNVGFKGIIFSSYFNVINHWLLYLYNRLLSDTDSCIWQYSVYVVQLHSAIGTYCFEQYNICIHMYYIVVHKNVMQIWLNVAETCRVDIYYM
jgi:hypothetical protein